jgi:hypothetical protein
MLRFLNIVLLLLFATIQAQDSAAWEVIVLAGDRLFTITPQGIAETLSSPAFDPMRGGHLAEAVITDGHIAIPLSDDVILTGDLHNETCCVEVPNPLPAYLAENGIIPEAMMLGGISPDGSMIVVGYVASGEPIGYSANFYGELLAVEVASGQVINQVPYTHQEYNVGPEFGPWLDDGLHYAVNCFLCSHGPLVSQQIIWQPQGNWLPTETHYESGSYLEATGELIEAVPDHKYAHLEQEGPLPLRNVIVYRPNLATNRTVVFHDPNYLNLSTPEWILNGNAYAFVEFQTGRYLLVYRDGSVHSLTGVGILTGTPDGWLARRRDGTILHYTDVDAYTELGILDPDSYPHVVSATPLGVNAELSPMQSTVGETIPPTVPPCAEDLPIRLRTGRTGRVTFTDGTALNLRDQAGSGGTVLLKMPEGTAFTVIVGPACIGEVNWWQIQLEDGTIGWASEGSKGVYYLEPYP